MMNIKVNTAQSHSSWLPGPPEGIMNQQIFTCLKQKITRLFFNFIENNTINRKHHFLVSKKKK